MKRKSRVYLKLLLSYVAILIIPILVATGIYGRGILYEARRQEQMKIF